MRARIIRRILAALAVVGITLLSSAPLFAAPKRCDTYPDERVINPGNGAPSYCGGTGDGCVMCYDIIIVR